MMEYHDCYKLPILKIIVEAVLLFGFHFFKLLKFGLPFIITVTLYLLYFNNVVSSGQPPEFPGFLILFPFFLILMATLVMAIVGCHRTFLMPKGDVAKTGIFRWSGRETRFVGWWLLIGLLTSLIGLPLLIVIVPFMKTTLQGSIENNYLLTVLLTLLNVPIYYVLSRWLLVLPATAIDERNKSLAWSWRLSTGNGWRLTFLVSGLPVITRYIIGYIPISNSILNAIVSGVLFLVVGAIGVALLSLSYAYLSQNVDLAEIDEKLAQENGSSSASNFDFGPDGPELQD